MTALPSSQPPDPSEPPETPDPPGPSEDYARELLVQVRYLLDDERSFGAKLVEDRKTKLSLLAVVVGLGLFKIESIGELYNILEGSPVYKLIFTWALCIGLGALLISIALIALERDPTPISGWVDRVWKWVAAKLAAGLCRLAGKTMSDAPNGDFDPREKFGAALVVLFGDRRETDLMGPELEWLTLRIEETRLAYLRLAEANRRVRKRLERGTLVLLVAFTSVIVVIGTVAMAASNSADVPVREKNHDDRDQNSNHPERGVQPIKGDQGSSREAGRDRSESDGGEAP